ncbi:hypothetical protein HDV03_003499 [Kappamyces sp. JEL0829]|nr:hypothetical protein HDV03_003499 [Kappamyces sp. JEL0829]
MKTDIPPKKSIRGGAGPGSTYSSASPSSTTSFTNSLTYPSFTTSAAPESIGAVSATTASVPTNQAALSQPNPSTSALDGDLQQYPKSLSDVDHAPLKLQGRIPSLEVLQPKPLRQPIGVALPPPPAHVQEVLAAQPSMVRHHVCFSDQQYYNQSHYNQTTRQKQEQIARQQQQLAMIRQQQLALMQQQGASKVDRPALLRQVPSHPHQMPFVPQDVQRNPAPRNSPRQDGQRPPPRGPSGSSLALGPRRSSSGLSGPGQSAASHSQAKPVAAKPKFFISEPCASSATSTLSYSGSSAESDAESDDDSDISDYGDISDDDDEHDKSLFSKQQLPVKRPSLLSERQLEVLFLSRPMNLLRILLPLN